MPKKKKEDTLANADNKGDRIDQLGALAAAAKQKYGHRVFMGADEASVSVVPRVSTGSFGMDYKTNGGLPLGRIIMLYGEKSSHKTSTLLRGLGNAQKLCANCYRPAKFKEGIIRLPDLVTGKTKEVETHVITECECGNPKDLLGLWIDAEHVWMSNWARKMGVWPEKVLLMRPDYGEQAYDMMVELFKRNIIDVVTLDSLAAMSPKAEVDTSMEQPHQGVSARMNNKFLRKLVMGMNECFNQYNRSPTLWLINQYREKIGVLFGDPRVVTGGKGQGFATTLEIECTPGKLDKDKETGEVFSVEFGYYVKKNKVGVPFGRGSFSMCLLENSLFEVGDLMEHKEVIEMAVEMGYVEKPTQMTYEYKGEKFRGKADVIRYFAENVSEYEYLKDVMLKYKLGVTELGHD